MAETRVWEERVSIPTYEIGEAEKNPIFLEKRVYQGSCGKVYPYPTVEKISNEKKDKEYRAVYLENEYLRVMVLPELGGRIQRAYDKTNGYDFVYYNQVIKPALVGLTGPWISGGIEFNWPQHHRPTTFLPVDYLIGEGQDGSVYVLCNDVDQMYGTKGLTKIALYPGKAYIEITGQLYNRTSMPQTFLWWANPAVSVNENTQSVFPPDVHAVMDHGKRDVSRFPIATGVYYKKDYSEGVDISRYKNIPVPTSYMAEKSKYDFVGGYDYGKEAGILHVADHHISPGKKQWTWGCGDFGKAWDRNLTDEDGPYVELMTGVYTDNQPDFTWMKPFEEKTFRQYFMPYKKLGLIKNASKEAAVSLSVREKEAEFAVYATAVYEDAEVILSYDGNEVYRERVNLSPEEIFRHTVELLTQKNPLNNAEKQCVTDEIASNPEVGASQQVDKNSIPLEIDEWKLKITVTAGEKCLVSYQPEKPVIPKLPEPAKAAKEPSEIMTNEELYLTGLHIEQYRHATYLPDPYYLEGLKRDPGDIRINNAYGALLLRRGQFTQAEGYFRKALERLTERNPNPYNSESYYLLGLVLFYQGRNEEAYDAFYKATWTNEQQEMSFYYLAAIDAGRGRFESAFEMVERALVKNAHNVKARGLKAYLLRKLGKTAEAMEWITANLALDPFDFISCNEQVICEAQKKIGEVNGACGNVVGGVCRDMSDGACAEMTADCRDMLRKMRVFPENYLMTARDYAEFGAYDEAILMLEKCPTTHPLLKYYAAYYTSRVQGDDGHNAESVRQLLREAENTCPDYCFPNKLEDIAVLRFAAAQEDCPMAEYYLGCLFYDKLQWQEAIELWEKAEAGKPEFPTVHRNLALAYYNKCGQPQKAKEELERAFELNREDVRVFLELDQLYKKLGMSFEDRLARYENYGSRIESRDDLYVEYITLLNMTGQYEKAYDCMMSHIFHPWEGGEGKITTQYTLCLLQMAKQALQSGEAARAEELLKQALVYPENLGEGKLEGTKDNHLYYHLGLACEMQAEQEEEKAFASGDCEAAEESEAFAAGKRREASMYFEKATIGTDEPAGAMYYNDQPADMILYQGLSFLKLGQTAAAKSRFYRLIDYGEQHLDDEMKIEYFAVSLPDFLIFEEDLTRKNRAHCYYLLGLGYLGLGEREKAAGFLEKTLELEPSHMMGNVYRDAV